MTNKKQAMLSHQTQQILADGMMAHLHLAETTGQNEKDITAAKIAGAASEAGIEPEMMAGAYFVYATGSIGNIRLRLEFDLEFSKAIGPAYAKKFVAEVTRWERQAQAEREERRKAPTLADVERISKERGERDRAGTASGKTVN